MATTPEETTRSTAPASPALAGGAGEVPTPVREHRLLDRSAAAGIPSRPLLGLPLRRLIPQDLHSLHDYASGASVALFGALTGGAAALAGGIMGLGTIAMSLMTDYRLSLAKLVPIEIHEVGDYVVGFGALLAPRLFGYHDTLAGRAHTVLGLSVVLGSLVTDYRAEKGVWWGKHRATDPWYVGA